MGSPSILFLHAADENYGSDRVLLSVIDAVRAQGASIRVLLPDDVAPGWLSGQLHERGVPVARVALAPARRRYLRPRCLPGYAIRLWRARGMLNRELATSFEVVYVNTSAVLAGAMVPRSARRRVVWHVHELLERPRLVAWLFRRLPMWRSDDVIAPSDAVAANLRRGRTTPARLHRVYNGIPARPVTARRSGDRLACAFVGRLQPRKGYDLFVDAAAQLARCFPTTHFLVAGTPPPGEEWRLAALKTRVSDLGLEGRLSVLGQCTDVPALLDASDVVVVPSRAPESFGLVTVEAMRSGCAVVATTVGATPEIVVDGTSGLLVPPDDSDRLVVALSRVLGDATLRARLGAAARRRAEDFSEERFQMEILRVLGLPR